MSLGKIISENNIQIEGDLTGATPKNFRLVRKEDADIPIEIHTVESIPGKEAQYLLKTQESLDPNGHYTLTAQDYGMSWVFAPSVTGMVLTAVISAALINNFVFTRYLGLCVFFGVSRRKETAIGMGVTFTIVGILSGMLSWLLNQYALHPLKLHFLQIITFIGIVACLVQATDMIIKKVDPGLHRKFGIYLVLITTNCIILAIPLLNATAQATFWEALGLSVGAGLGFALALFLMSCCREQVDLAPVPRVFRGLPIAFIIAGLFALSFLGFSGL